MLKMILTLIISCFLILGCTTTPTPNGKISTAKPSSKELLQSDVNRMATINMEDNLESLYKIANLLYIHNPKELKKSGLPQKNAIQRLKNAIETRAPWKNLQEKSKMKALEYTLSPQFKGDRVAAFIYAVSDVIIKAHGNRIKFYLLNGLDGQELFNAARNLDKIESMLTHSSPFYFPETLNKEFNKEFGKIIGRIDSLGEFVTEKYRRAGVGYIQGLLGGSLFQFLPVF